jgi:hypothetical protein
MQGRKHRETFKPGDHAMVDQHRSLEVRTSMHDSVADG